MLQQAVGLLLAALVAAHSDHTFDLHDESDIGMPYAERHMHTEHHIDSFDLESFFKLHDLNMDGVWDEPEIQAVYGLHHHSVKEKIPQPELIEGRTQMIVEAVLKKLDTNRDRLISLAEFIAGGNEGLPSFEGYQELGHHYDEESEYFLHHEELYHSTPETQTDEAYNHPEDLQHFKHHAHIEEEEDAKERKFEGLAPDADLAQDHVAVDPLDQHAHAPGEGPPGTETLPKVPLKAGDAVPPKLQRTVPGAAPQRLQEGDERPGKEDWAKASRAAGGAHYRADDSRPRTDEERMKKGVPYKYKFRKGLRAEEF